MLPGGCFYWWVLTSRDPGRLSSSKCLEGNKDSGTMWKGQVLSIHITSAAGEGMELVREVRAVTGRGLQGDRYFEGTGKYSKRGL